MAVDALVALLIQLLYLIFILIFFLLELFYQVKVILMVKISLQFLLFYLIFIFLNFCVLNKMLLNLSDLLNGRPALIVCHYQRIEILTKGNKLKLLYGFILSYSFGFCIIIRLLNHLRYRYYIYTLIIFLVLNLSIWIIHF